MYKSMCDVKRLNRKEVAMLHVEKSSTGMLYDFCNQGKVTKVFSEVEIKTLNCSCTLCTGLSLVH